MISVIIPIFNGHDMAQQCILSVLENTKDFELIIVDNGSTPPFVPPFSGFVNTTLIRNEENTGFPCAINTGVARAAGDIILLLNDDVIVTPGSINRLADYLDTVDIVGPTTNYCAGLQRVTLPVYSSIEGLNKEAGALAQTCEGELEEVNWVIGFCMAFKKSLFEKIGPFDESLWPCSGEEIDFCLSARKAGYKIAIAHDVYVHHEGSKTFSAMERAGQVNYKEICKRNDDHLAKKWGNKFWLRQSIEDENKKHVKIGDYSYVDGQIDVTFSDEANLSIGKFCSIAQKCKIILGGNHRNDWISTYPFPAEGLFPDSPDIPGYRGSKGDITIGNDVWIGAGVTILSGVTIGDGAIIGAGSVVVKNVPPYALAAGNPARFKKFRFDQETIARLLELEWWNWPEPTIREAIPLLMSDDIEGLFEFAKGELCTKIH
jgi:acetyltransferase-like isoleucine patch superfamily enzyme